MIFPSVLYLGNLSEWAKQHKGEDNSILYKSDFFPHGLMWLGDDFSRNEANYALFFTHVLLKIHCHLPNLEENMGVY